MKWLLAIWSIERWDAGCEKRVAFGRKAVVWEESEDGGERRGRTDCAHRGCGAAGRGVGEGGGGRK